MKTYIFTAIITAMINPAYFFAHVPAFRYTLEEEAYVDDIGFDTEVIVYEVATKMNEEAYVDDIPFNTTAVANSLGTRLPDEAYVDDIPFDTYEMAVNGRIDLPAEEYVDDIPFDTECIVNNRHLKNEMMKKCIVERKTESTSSMSAHDGSRETMARMHEKIESK